MTSGSMITVISMYLPSDARVAVDVLDIFAARIIVNGNAPRPAARVHEEPGAALAPRAHPDPVGQVHGNAVGLVAAARGGRQEDGALDAERAVVEALDGFRAASGNPYPPAAVNGRAVGVHVHVHGLERAAVVRVQLVESLLVVEADPGVAPARLDGTEVDHERPGDAVAAAHLRGPQHAMTIQVT